MWPLLFELNPGDVFTLITAAGRREVKLLEVCHTRGPDFWKPGGGQVLLRSEVKIDVSGIIVSLWLQPFQLPVVVNGIRISVELTREWAEECEEWRVVGMRKQVRFSALDATRHWGPENLVFPIRKYRWRGTTYNNTWAARVPMPALVYGRGEDFGAVPDKMDVVSMFEGTVVHSPISFPDGDTDMLQIDHGGGISVTYRHLRPSSLHPSLIVGAPVKTGQLLGRVGCAGTGDAISHLHVHMQRSNDLVNAFPYLVQAYFQTFPDEVLAIAGGQQVARLGEEISLDGMLSIPRPGGRIAEWNWRLHQGRSLRSARAAVRFEAAGLYAEELVVQGEAGEPERDFAQIRVLDPATSVPQAYGWACFHPLRDILPGMPVLFRGKFHHVRGPVRVDFGDDSPRDVFEGDVWHSYSRPGDYSLTIRAEGEGGEPILLKLPVRVKRPG